MSALPAETRSPTTGRVTVIDTRPGWQEIPQGGHALEVVAPSDVDPTLLAESTHTLLNLAASGAFEALSTLRAAGFGRRVWAYLATSDSPYAVPLGPIETTARPLDNESVVATLQSWAPKEKRVLTVGEDATAFLALRPVLVQQGWSVSLAWDSRQASDLLPLVRPSVVIIDLDDPAGGGYEVVLQLASADPAPSMLLIPGRGDDAAAFLAVLEKRLRAAALCPRQSIVAAVVSAAPAQVSEAAAPAAAPALRSVRASILKPPAAQAAEQKKAAPQAAVPSRPVPPVSPIRPAQPAPAPVPPVVATRPSEPAAPVAPEPVAAEREVAAAPVVSETPVPAVAAAEPEIAEPVALPSAPAPEVAAPAETAPEPQVVAEAEATTEAESDDDAPFDEELPLSHPTLTDEGHQKAFASVVRAIERREGFIALLGKQGSGKTTLLRALHETLGEAPKSFLLLGLSVEGAPSSSTVEALSALLRERAPKAGMRAVLVDDAEALDASVLDALRKLVQGGVQVVLAGRPKLRLRLTNGRGSKKTGRRAYWVHLESTPAAVQPSAAVSAPAAAPAPVAAPVEPVAPVVEPEPPVMEAPASPAEPVAVADEAPAPTPTIEAPVEEPVAAPAMPAHRPQMAPTIDAAVRPASPAPGFSRPVSARRPASARLRVVSVATALAAMGLAAYGMISYVMSYQSPGRAVSQMRVAEAQAPVAVVAAAQPPPTIVPLDPPAPSARAARATRVAAQMPVAEAQAPVAHVAAAQPPPTIMPLDPPAPSAHAAPATAPAVADDEGTEPSGGEDTEVASRAVDTAPAAPAAAPAETPRSVQRVAVNPLVRPLDGSQWTIQLAAIRNAATAASMRDRLADHGLQAFVQPVTVGSETLHRVLVGHYPSRPAAEKAAAGLRTDAAVGTALAL